jgi:hypothetical protein
VVSLVAIPRHKDGLNAPTSVADHIAACAAAGVRRWYVSALGSAQSPSMYQRSKRAVRQC